MNWLVGQLEIPAHPIHPSFPFPFLFLFHFLHPHPPLNPSPSRIGRRERDIIAQHHVAESAAPLVLLRLRGPRLREWLVLVLLVEGGEAGGIVALRLGIRGRRKTEAEAGDVARVPDRGVAF